MNKKHLSVVMAGAMLASSVAPVLAADLQKKEYSAAELGILKKDLRELLESKKFHSTDKLAGESVYYITKGLTGEHCKTVDKLDDLLKNLKAGDKLYVWSEGFRVDEKGNYFSTTKTEDSIVGKYTSSDLYDVKTGKVEGTKLFNQIQTECWQVQSDGKYNEAAKYLIQKEHTYLVPEKTAVIEMANNRQIVLTEGSEILDFSKPVDKDGYEVKFNNGDLVDTNGTIKSYSSLSDELKNKVDSIVGFKSKTVKGEEGKDITNERIEEITITTGGNNVLVSDLYDGLMLTEKGHDLLSEIKYYDKVSGNKDKVTVNKVEKITGTNNYQFTIEFKTVSALSEKTLIVTGTNKDDAERLQKWLEERNAKVDILAGSNRYATAVKIAKEQVFGNKNLKDSNYKSNIVLVNGDSLVDGLSAAPLASHLKMTNTINESTAAPVLLTESDKLPKETKAYLKELVDNKTINNLNTTIHLVGGTSVLSKSLERELKGLGFDVERYGGANREETSLKVAEKINSDDVFVVGGNGEADAMSIAAVAANSKTPIVVAKNGGISEDAIDDLKGANVTVVGGEQLISKADFESIKSEAKSINRVAGANRQATNALVIEKYYAGTFGDTQNVIVAKDGQHNKNELIDALAAANMASEKKAPVVLATNKLSKAQINALELNAKNANALYQVGHGVSRDVVKTIAQRLGLAN